MDTLNVQKQSVNREEVKNQIKEECIVKQMNTPLPGRGGGGVLCV